MLFSHGTKPLTKNSFFPAKRFQFLGHNWKLSISLVNFEEVALKLDNKVRSEISASDLKK